MKGLMQIVVTAAIAVTALFDSPLAEGAVNPSQSSHNIASKSVSAAASTNSDYNGLVPVARQTDIGNSFCLRGKMNIDIAHVREADSLNVWYNSGATSGVVQMDRDFTNGATKCLTAAASDPTIARAGDRIRISPGTKDRYLFTLYHKNMSDPQCAPDAVQTDDCYTAFFSSIPMEMGFVHGRFLYLKAHLPGKTGNVARDYFVMLADANHGDSADAYGNKTVRNMSPIDKYYIVEVYPDPNSQPPPPDPAACYDERPSADTLTEWTGDTTDWCNQFSTMHQTGSSGGGQHPPDWP